jgi:hypothetical protein
MGWGVMFKRIMVARDIVHFAVENLLNLVEDLVGLLKLLGLIVVFVILITVGSVTTDQNQIKMNFILSMP